MKLNEILKEAITEKQFEKLEDALQDILGPGIDVTGMDIMTQIHHDISMVDVDRGLEILLGLVGTFDDDDSAKVVQWTASLEGKSNVIRFESEPINGLVIKYDNAASVKAAASLIVNALEEKKLIFKQNNIYYLSDK